jgi:isochorismate pyruvate lyase
MMEVRHGVDRLDEEIVALLAERFRYMGAAARIKPSGARFGRGAQGRGDRQRRHLRWRAGPAAVVEVYERLWKLDRLQFEVRRRRAAGGG